jgi:hypothetical protein
MLSSFFVRVAEPESAIYAAISARCSAAGFFFFIYRNELGA